MLDADFERGRAGEDMVVLALEKLGYKVYQTRSPGAHRFDMLFTKGKQMYLGEVKTKPRRWAYPDTGYNLNSHYIYNEESIKHNLPFYVFFVDESIKKIYYSTINNLIIRRCVEGKCYPSIEPTRMGDNIIYFPLGAMENLCDIDDDGKIYNLASGLSVK